MMEIELTWPEEQWSRLRYCLADPPTDESQLQEIWFDLLNVLEHPYWQNEPVLALAIQYIRKHTRTWRKFNFHPRLTVDYFEKEDLPLLFRLGAIGIHEQQV